jgi:hypothetical protein
MRNWILLLCSALFAMQSHADTLAGGFITIKEEAIVWKTAENGIRQAVLYGDPSKPGVYVVRNIFPAGIMSTPHDHDQDRWVTVMHGTWYAGTDASWDPKTTLAMPQGSTMFHPAHAVHFDGSLHEPVMVQIIGIGPVKTTYVYPSEGKFGVPRKLN